MAEGTRKAAESPELTGLLDYLRTSRGFDFTGYKKASLERRIAKRIREVGCESYADYQDYLEVNPTEFTDLFNTILINVTAFFRDREAWDYLASDVLPKLLADLPDAEPIRVWSAACASGAEACSAAMQIAEAVGEAAVGWSVSLY